ncbi:MAG: hypothetical protein WC702_00260 [Patescibacteria group bacterium]
MPKTVEGLEAFLENVTLAKEVKTIPNNGVFQERLKTGGYSLISDLLTLRQDLEELISPAVERLLVLSPGEFPVDRSDPSFDVFT